jgi:anti-anti-sigma factor
MSVEALNRPQLEDEPELSVSLCHDGTTCTLTLRGELRAASVAVLEAQFDRLGSTPCHRVLLDLTDLSGIDTTGAKVLTGLRHYVAARGGRLRVVGACGGVAAALGADGARVD